MALQLNTATISILLDQLEKGGLIDRKMAVEDRRSIQITVTEKGLSIRDNVLQTIAVLNDEFLRRFTVEQRRAFVRALQKLAGSNGLRA